MDILPVILCGGSGSRLWPQSRSLYPKQFLPLVNDQTMLQNTVARLQGIADTSAPLIIANEEHRFLVAEQLRQVNVQPSGILLEPAGRNTAPAVALAALKARSSGSDPVLLVLAADHVIQDETAFHNAVNSSMPAAHDGKLVTFGIVPTHPETGYGYIRAGKSQGGACAPVEQFVEKPDHATAEQYLAAGGYYWNSGMFMFKASRYLEELKAHRPDILTACESALAVEHPDLDFVRLDEGAFRACPEDSIDYAVMEKNFRCRGSATGCQVV